MLAGEETEIPAPVTTTIRREVLTASHTRARSRCGELEQVDEGGIAGVSGVGWRDEEAEEGAEEEEAAEGVARGEGVMVSLRVLRRGADRVLRGADSDGSPLRDVGGRGGASGRERGITII